LCCLIRSKIFLIFFPRDSYIKQQPTLYKAVKILAVIGRSVVDTYELEYHMVAMLETLMNQNIMSTHGVFK